MECAIVAKERGHEVIVLEQGDRAGGQVWIGASSPLRATWSRIGDFYSAQAAKMDVRYNTVATKDLIESLGPDVVVLATGSRPKEMPGTLTILEALTGSLTGHTLVVDREGTMRPWVVVDLLSSQGHEIDFATTMTGFTPNTDAMVAEEFVRHFEQRRVTFHPRVDLVDWNGHDAIMRDVATAEEYVIHNLAQVVVAQGSISNEGLARDLRATGIELHVIGDANAPSTMDSATFQGHRLGRLL
jgi:NADPH-dependent 2,4-dienoyl-CoA reductase/sulfur reductase-like enzyme